MSKSVIQMANAPFSTVAYLKGLYVNTAVYIVHTQRKDALYVSEALHCLIRWPALAKSVTKAAASRGDRVILRPGGCTPDDR